MYSRRREPLLDAPRLNVAAFNPDLAASQVGRESACFQSEVDVQLTMPSAESGGRVDLDPAELQRGLRQAAFRHTPSMQKAYGQSSALD